MNDLPEETPGELEWAKDESKSKSEQESSQPWEWNDTSTISSRLLAIPHGEAEALPSVRVANEEVQHGQYGGLGDKKHLGGFTDLDLHGISPDTWRFMQEIIGVKSVLDVGCGRGISTSWFLHHKLDALCVEGSHDAYMNSVLPDPPTQMVEHDFSRGPWWPSKTYDAVWCVEFLEHVGRQFHQNYLPAFRKAALIFATHSNWGGFHHVEVHKDPWWIVKFQMYGFVYSTELTNQVRQIAKTEFAKRHPSMKDNEPYNPQHVWLTMMVRVYETTRKARQCVCVLLNPLFLLFLKVFINPAVAVLPEHAHVMAEKGCFERRIQETLVHKECGTGRNAHKETPLPDRMKPIPLENPQESQRQWEDYIRAHLGLNNSTRR